MKLYNSRFLTKMMMQLGRNFVQKCSLAPELYCHFVPRSKNINDTKLSFFFFFCFATKLHNSKFEIKNDAGIRRKFVQKLGLELYHHHHFKEDPKHCDLFGF